MKKVMMIGAAILALQAVPALAQTDAAPAKDGGKHHGKMFEEADADKDGTVSKSEFKDSADKRAEKKFDSIDANKDGKVTKEELKAHHDAMKAKWDKHKMNKKPDGAPKAE